MFNAKAKGSRNERKTIRLLEAAGYRCTKSGSSLGVWDVIGIGPTDLVLVQVKSNRGPDPTEREAMRMFSAPPNAKKLIHVWYDNGRMPVVKEVDGPETTADWTRLEHGMEGL